MLQIVLAVILGIVVLVIAWNLLGWLFGIISSILTSTVFWAVAGIAAVAIAVYVVRGNHNSSHRYEKDEEESPHGQSHTYIPPEDVDGQEDWQESEPSPGSDHNTPWCSDRRYRNSKNMDHPRSYILPPDSWDVLDGPSLLHHEDDDKKDKKE